MALTVETLKVKKHCNRCGHVMWFEESTNRWWCTNQKCKKYKAQPDNGDSDDLANYRMEE